MFCKQCGREQESKKHIKNQDSAMTEEDSFCIWDYLPAGSEIYETGKILTANERWFMIK